MEHLMQLKASEANSAGFRTSVFQFRPYHGTLLYKRLKARYPNQDIVLGKQGYNSFSLDDNFNYQSFNIDGILYVPVHHPSFILVYRRKFIDKYMSAVSTFSQKLPVPAGV